jgi:hypothetical protein
MVGCGWKPVAGVFVASNTSTEGEGPIFECSAIISVSLPARELFLDCAPLSWFVMRFLSLCLLDRF